MNQGPASDTVSFDPSGEKRQRAPVPIWVKVVATVALIAVLLPIGFRAYDWWRHPTLFGGTYDNNVTSIARPGMTMSFQLSRPHSGHADTVTFRGTPEHRWRVNTAAATLTVEVCHVGSARSAPGPRDRCSHLNPVRDGTTFRYPSRHEYLLAVVHVAKPGRSTLDTITYNYTVGTQPWSQRGLDTQNFPHLTFKVRNPPTTS
jgi:hypothetical protein